MIMNILKKSGIMVSALVLTLFASCSANINGTISEGGAAEIVLNASLEPAAAGIIRSFHGFMGGAAGAPILDGPAMGRSMAAAPGIRAVALRNTGPAALDGTVSITNIGDFLASDDLKNRFITYTEGGAGLSSIIITLDRDSSPALISRLSPEIVEYLSALMAPAVLGETGTKQEYLEILSMVYGKQLADEIAAAKIHASVEFPRTVTTVKGGRPAGKRAEFEIPLTDLLVLENPLRYEVYW
jgi:hypothetical protein